MTPARHLVVMAKAPRIGRVKSRLAEAIGPVAAWTFQRRNLDALLRRMIDPRWRSWIAVAPDAAVHTHPWPRGWSAMAQGGGDLGARMARIMASLPPGPVVIVGADIPAIGPQHAIAAFRALGDADAVFGPAADGGYWLVGLRRRPRIPDPFAPVRWSGPHALTDTRANLPTGTRTAVLETLEDVDDVESLSRAATAYFRCSFRRGISSTKLHGL